MNIEFVLVDFQISQKMNVNVFVKNLTSETLGTIVVVKKLILNLLNMLMVQ
jgi:hypothetical protein